MTVRSLLLASALAMSALGSGPARAGYTVQLVDYPGGVSSQNLVIGLNNHGQAVGYFSLTDYSHVQTYVYSGGSYTALPGNGYVANYPKTILNDGTIIGTSVTGAVNDQYSFVYKASNYEIYRVPGSTWTNGTTLVSGYLYGTYAPNGTTLDHGFKVDSFGNITTYLFPGAGTTGIGAVNASGNFVGTYYYGYYNPGPFAYIHDSTGFHMISIPGAIETSATVLSSDNTVAGFYTSLTGLKSFIWKDGVAQTIEFPGYTNAAVYGINDQKWLSGALFDSNGVQHGFIAIPDAIPEPATIGILATGLAVLAGCLRRPRRRLA